MGGLLIFQRRHGVGELALAAIARLPQSLSGFFEFGLRFLTGSSDLGRQGGSLRVELDHCLGVALVELHRPVGEFTLECPLVACSFGKGTLVSFGGFGFDRTPAFLQHCQRREVLSLEGSCALCELRLEVALAGLDGGDGSFMTGGQLRFDLASMFTERVERVGVGGPELDLSGRKGSLLVRHGRKSSFVGVAEGLTLTIEFAAGPLGLAPQIGANAGDLLLRLGHQRRRRLDSTPAPRFEFSLGVGRSLRGCIDSDLVGVGLGEAANPACHRLSVDLDPLRSFGRPPSNDNGLVLGLGLQPASLSLRLETLAHEPAPGLAFDSANLLLPPADVVEHACPLGLGGGHRAPVQLGSHHGRIDGGFRLGAILPVSDGSFLHLATSGTTEQLELGVVAAF